MNSELSNVWDMGDMLSIVFSSFRVELGEDSTGNLVAIKKYKKYFVTPEIIAKEF